MKSSQLKANNLINFKNLKKSIMFIAYLICQVLQISSISALNLSAYAKEIDNVSDEVIESIDKYVINVENIYQNPELPNGCEIVSGAILLKNLGYNVSKTDLADNYLVKSSGWYGADPYHEYMGNPRNQSGASCGFYVYPGPVIDACNLYIEKHPEMVESGQVDNEYQFYDIQNCSFENLLKVIKSGRPVAVWVTIGFREPGYYGYAWTSRYGNYIKVRRNLHCLVLNGFDIGQSIVNSDSDTIEISDAIEISDDAVAYVTDPLGINKTISLKQFKYVWETMGSFAMTYRIKDINL